jgi:ribose 5-phosphate isomerase B
MINRTIYIASDHGGFELKNYLVGELIARGYTVNNLGPETYNPEDDYPDYVKKVTEAVSKSEKNGSGILICRNGVGVSVLANKFAAIRCALSWSPEHARSARNDDDANVLALPADYITKETALQTSLAFLETPFSAEERYVRRLNKYGNTGNS